MSKNLINRVDDGFNYFITHGMIENLSTDERYYVESFMNYIEHLESQYPQAKKQIKNQTR